MGLRKHALDVEAEPTNFTPQSQRLFQSVATGSVAVVMQLVSVVLLLVGTDTMHNSLSDAGIEQDGKMHPWVTASVICFCIAVVGLDVFTLYVVAADKAPAGCTKCFALLLHIFMWFCVTLFSLSTAVLVLGTVIKGLGDTNSISDTDTRIFYGFSGTEINALYLNIGSYMQGATLLCVGSFLSIPSQGWMLSAMSVQLAVYESRMTVYKGPSSRHSPNRPKTSSGFTTFSNPTTPAHPTDVTGSHTPSKENLGERIRASERRALLMMSEC